MLKIRAKQTGSDQGYILYVHAHQIGGILLPDPDYKPNPPYLEGQWNPDQDVHAKILVLGKDYWVTEKAEIEKLRVYAEEILSDWSAADDEWKATQEMLKEHMAKATEPTKLLNLGKPYADR